MRGFALAAALLVAPASLAQTPPAPVLVIQQERMFDASAFGRAARARLDAASEALIAENRRIEQELEAEERALSDRRPELPPVDFRALADAFNEKVERIRADQDAKLRDLSRSGDDDRKLFFEAALPVLAELLREKGALVILDQQAVVLSLDAIDITQEAIARIDARLSSGTSAMPQP